MTGIKAEDSRDNVGMPKRRDVVQMPPLSFRATVDSIDAEARTVELIFTTGASVERRDYWTGESFLEKLSLERGAVRVERLDAGAPLLDSHNGYSVRGQLGTVVPGSVRLTKKDGRATVRFSKREDVEPIWQDVRDGIIRDVSVGYRTHAIKEEKGSEGKPTIRTAIDWEPYELSLTPMGADAGAKVRDDDVQTTRCVITRKVQEEPMSKKRTQTLETEPVVTQPPVVTPPEQSSGDGARTASEIELEAQARKVERERGVEIRRIVRTAKLGDEMADRFIADGNELDEVRKAIFIELEKKGDGPRIGGPNPAVVPGEDERDKYVRGVGAWLFQKSGVTDIVREARKADPDNPRLRDTAFDPGEFRGMSLLDLARQDLERRAVSTRGMSKLDVAGMAFRGVAGAQSTSDFAVGLEVALHKTLLAAFTVTPDKWRRFCAVGTVSDFRAHDRYRTGYLAALDTVVQGGEFTNATLPDATKESITAVTKGKIIALTRQAIVNDDMGMFSRVITQMGRAASLSIEADVFAELALNAGLGPAMNDGDTLFHANHNNLGGGAALSITAIDADATVMAAQTDASGNEILDLSPAVLVVPRGLQGLALQVNEAQFEDFTDGLPNRVLGLFRDVVGTGRMTGTRRYMFADPAMEPVIEVAFLDGQQEPFLESMDGWRVDGIEWKVRLDYGVSGVGFRGALTDAGV